jgi:hypothetical protein
VGRWLEAHVEEDGRDDPETDDGERRGESESDGGHDEGWGLKRLLFGVMDEEDRAPWR